MAEIGPQQTGYDYKRVTEQQSVKVMENFTPTA
jgi:hypothetical protein